MNETSTSSVLNGSIIGWIANDMGGTNGAIQFRRFYDGLAVFWQAFPPFIFVFGTFGNVMTIVICRRREVASSMSVFFVTLAGSDLLSLNIHAIGQWIYYVFDVEVISLHSVVCKLTIWAGYVTGVLSAWILVAMTAQRTVCVLWPHRANILCSARNSKVIALSMTLFLAVLHCHLLYGLDVMIFSYNSHTINSTAVKVCHVNFRTNSTDVTVGQDTLSAKDTDVALGGSANTIHDTTVTFNGRSYTAAVCVLTREYVGFYFSVWSWFDLLIVSVLPWLCLVVSNCVLLWTLNVSIRQAQHSLGSAHTHGFSGRKKQASSMTVTLFAVSSAFIVLNLPMSCIQLTGFYHHMAGSLDYYYQSEVIAYCHEIALALYETNNAVNFYLYCLTGSKFRRELKKTFSCDAGPESRRRGDTLSSRKETNTM